MSWSKEKNQAKLNAIYGIDFPDSLFWLHEFIILHADDSIDLSDICLHPGGPLALLLKFDDISTAKFTGDPLLHWRYYRDLPEFFTCLVGEGDGLHWGMLLDEPLDGFRGAAKYYSNDGCEISVYGSLFDAILRECDNWIESCEHEIIFGESAAEIEKSNRERKQYQKICQRFKHEFENFIEINSISLDEGRPIGDKNSTGLDIVLVDDFDRDLAEAHEMLSQGRNLWYWDGEQASREAFHLMRQAYKMLGRRELIRILETHFRYRNSLGVDFLQPDR